MIRNDPSKKGSLRPHGIAQRHKAQFKSRSLGRPSPMFIPDIRDCRVTWAHMLWPLDESLGWGSGCGGAKVNLQSLGGLLPAYTGQRAEEAD
jgi:hypothetical protein